MIYLYFENFLHIKIELHECELLISPLHGVVSNEGRQSISQFLPCISIICVSRRKETTC